MLKLYGLPGACSLAPHIALEEAGLPYAYHPVQKGDASFDEVRRRNPMAQVPVLEFADGGVLTQNAAILSWIAAQAPDAKLLPEPGTMERIRAEEWLSLLGTSLHPPYVPFFNPGKVIADEAKFDEAKEVARGQVRAALEVVEARLGDGPWALGSTYSAVDPYLFVLVSWAAPVASIDMSAFPNLQRHAAAMMDRPATHRAMAAEGLLQG